MLLMQYASILSYPLFLDLTNIQIIFKSANITTSDTYIDFK